MILAEGFECLIPSNNAVKTDVLYCSGQASNGWEITGFLIDAFAALGTLASVGIAIWVALDARRRVADERARADRAERESRIREASARVVSAFSSYVENLETDDQSKFYGVPNSIVNLSIAYGDATTERNQLCSALDRAVTDLLQPLFVGWMRVSTASASRELWDGGVKFWQHKLTYEVSKVRNLFDALNGTNDPKVRADLISNFEYEMELGAKSLQTSMSRFEKERI